MDPKLLFQLITRITQQHPNLSTVIKSDNIYTYSDVLTVVQRIDQTLKIYDME